MAVITVEELVLIVTRKVAEELRSLPRMTEPGDGSLWVDSEALDALATKLETDPPWP